MPEPVPEVQPAADAPRRPNEGRDVVPLPEAGAVLRGVVERLERYGAFIALEPRRVYRGLLHISEISDRHVSRVDNVLNVGEQVNVRVLEVDAKRGRISVSMKGVTQPWQEALQAAQPGETQEAPEEQEAERRPATLQDLADRFGRPPAPARPAAVPRNDRGARDKEQLAAIMRRLRGQ